MTEHMYNAKMPRDKDIWVDCNAPYFEERNDLVGITWFNLINIIVLIYKLLT